LHAAGLADAHGSVLVIGQQGAGKSCQVCCRGPRPAPVTASSPGAARSSRTRRSG
jgi:hypothetical protein